MRHQLRKLSGLFRSPLGRRVLRAELFNSAWPLLALAATIHRRTLARRVRLVVVVGTFGKTTTTRAVAAALERRLHRLAAANWGGQLALAVLRLRPGDRHAVVEVGISGPGEMAGYARLVRPDIVVVTSIGSEHARALGGLEDTRAEKVAMVRALPANGLAILNGDDPHVRWMAGQTTARVVSFGFGDGCDPRASDYALDWPRGSRFTLQVGGVSWPVRSRLLGRHHVYPLLAAVGVGLAMGLALDEVVSRLAELPPTPGRLEPAPLPNGAWLLCDDRKATVETLDAALDVLAEIPARRKIGVLGEAWDPLGNLELIYGRLGERVGRIADRAIFVGQVFPWYAAGAQRGGLPASAVVDAGSDVLGAAAALQTELAAGDVVLIAGYGSQRLNRIGLLLAGRQVRCDVALCGTRVADCPTCPMLERGWAGLPVLF